MKSAFDLSIITYISSTLDRDRQKKMVNICLKLYIYVSVQSVHMCIFFKASIFHVLNFVASAHNSSEDLFLYSNMNIIMLLPFGLCLSLPYLLGNVIIPLTRKRVVYTLSM